MAGSAIKTALNSKCGNCGKVIDEHSKKNFARCLYVLNVNLYQAILTMQNLRKMVNKNEKEKETTPQEDAQSLLDAENKDNWKSEKKPYQSVATEEG